MTDRDLLENAARADEEILPLNECDNIKPRTGPSHEVMIVDDNEERREKIKVAIQNSGLDVFFAASLGAFTANGVGRPSHLPRRLFRALTEDRRTKDSESPEALAKIAAANEKRSRRNEKRRAAAAIGEKK